ncbi:hypothetical protein EGW08_016000, partial [Elysia chlorotica]
LPFYWVFDVCVDEQAVHFTVDILHCNLETVKAASLCYLHFLAEPYTHAHQIFIYNAITGCKKGQHMRDEVFLLFLQLLPLVKVFGEINFFRSPERSLCLLVHLPYIMILDGEYNKTPRVLSQEG